MTTSYKDNREGSKVLPWEYRVASVLKGNSTHIPTVLTNWGWAIAFFTICAFNGWMLNLYSVSLPSVLYFAIFPLGASVYIFSRNTKVLVISHMISHIILAWVICGIEFNSSIMPIIFYGINLVFFAFILAYVTRENGAIIPVLILCSTFILLIVFGWQWIGRIVWYCNLTFTANKTEKNMRQFIDDFDTTILALCGISTLGLAIGWRFAGIFA